MFLELENSNIDKFNFIANSSSFLLATQRAVLRRILKFIVIAD